MHLRPALFLLLLLNIPLGAQQVMVLGIAQDAGKPQLACSKECCAELPPNFDGSPVSLAILDSNSKKWYLIEASPAIKKQLLKIPSDYPALPEAIFLTHAHIGHYSGLVHFGREAANSQRISTYSGPRFCEFLRNNGPWSQLVSLKNIIPKAISSGDSVKIASGAISIKAIAVPHRDEYSETFGYLISGPKKRLLFIPDIDKWERWELDIDSIIKKVDYALLDATFFDSKELHGRDMAEIPHPFVKESMQRWQSLGANEKRKIHFIHLNHSNPLWDKNSSAYRAAIEAGFRVAEVNQVFSL